MGLRQIGCLTPYEYAAAIPLIEVTPRNPQNVRLPDPAHRIQSGKCRSRLPDDHLGEPDGGSFSFGRVQPRHEAELGARQGALEFFIGDGFRVEALQFGVDVGEKGLTGMAFTGAGSDLEE